MSNQTLTARMVQRNDTAANWISTNPVMLKGELGVEIDTNKFKFGDGASTWTELDYAGTVVTASGTNGHILIDGVNTTVYSLPIATAAVIGGVKSSTGTNAVSIDAAGVMTISKASAAVLADSATKLATSRTLSVTGDATGSTTFDGSANASTALTLATVATAGTYPKVTVNAKGLVTAGASLTAADIPSLDTSILTTGTIAAARLPIATTTLGVVKSSTGTNAVSVDVAGNMTISKASAATLADSATKLATSRTLSVTGDATGSTTFDGSANVSTALTLATVATAGTYPKVTVNAKGLVTAGASLTAADIPGIDASKLTSGIIDSARLPSYVDDVIEAANYASLPTTGETGKLYITLDTNKQYRWSGTVYVAITSGAVDSVNGKTGLVTLTTSNISEGSNLYYTSARATSNFTSNFAAASSTSLSDSATLVRSTDTLIINCGNA